MKQLLYLILLIAANSCKGQPPLRKEGIIKAGTSRIYWTRTGEGPALLLVHAGLMDHKMWEPQVNYFKKRYNVITIDLPGHGSSSVGDSVRLMLDYIKTCLDSLKVEKVHLVGLSLGGRCVADFALAYPDRVETLVLAAAIPVGYENRHKPDSLTQRYFMEFRDAYRRKELALAAEVFTRYWCDGIRTPAEVDSAVRGYVYRSALGTLKNHPFNPPQFAEPPAIDRIARFNKPVLILEGNKDLPVIHEAALFMEKQFPHSERKELKGVAHMLNMEAPDSFNEMVEQFLKKAKK